MGLSRAARARAGPDEGFGHGSSSLTEARARAFPQKTLDLWSVERIHPNQMMTLN